MPVQEHRHSDGTASHPNPSDYKRGFYLSCALLGVNFDLELALRSKRRGGAHTKEAIWTLAPGAFGALLEPHPKPKSLGKRRVASLRSKLLVLVDHRSRALD